MIPIGILTQEPLTITSDATNLMTKDEYYGLDQVHIGNDLGLSIYHVGQSVFSSPCTSKILT